jgi:SAM-dependent methyltransferase
VRVPLFDGARDGVIADFLARLPPPAPVSTEICGEDEMYRHALGSLRGSEAAAAILYFGKGRQVLEAVRAVAAWGLGGLAAAASVLDFAAGWGRSTRYLVADVLASRVTVCEIDARAVAFQEEAFGVRGIVSAADPARFDPGGSFDLVVASSFFTHVPPERFAGWLARLYSLVAPGGVLMFSTHGPSLAPAGEDIDGVLFRPESENSRLPSEEYGTTWVTEEYVRASLGEPCLAVPSGFCAEQDLYVVRRLRGEPARDLVVPILPRGDCDLFTLAPDGRALAEGWVSDSSAVVALYVGADELARETPRQGRWRFAFDWRGIRQSEVLRVEASVPGGVPGILAMSPIGPHLPGTR